MVRRPTLTESPGRRGTDSVIVGQGGGPDLTVEYRIVPGEPVVWIEVSGDISAREIESAVHALCADPAIPLGVALIVDQSGLVKPPSASVVSVAPGLLLRLAGDKGVTRCATIAPADATFGVNRMIEVHAERTPVEVRTFKTREEAGAWIRERGAGTA